MLQSMGSQKVGHHWVTEMNWTPALQADSLLSETAGKPRNKIKYIDLWNKKIHKKSWGTWENIVSKNAYKTPLGKSPPNPLKFHDEESVISVVILTEIHTREFYKKNPFLQTTINWQNNPKETHTYLLHMILCCPVQKQNQPLCCLIHYSLLPCGQKTRPVS